MGETPVPPVRAPTCVPSRHWHSVRHAGHESNSSRKQGIWDTNNPRRQCFENSWCQLRGKDGVSRPRNSRMGRKSKDAEGDLTSARKTNLRNSAATMVHLVVKLRSVYSTSAFGDTSFQRSDDATASNSSGAKNAGRCVNPRRLAPSHFLLR